MQPISIEIKNYRSINTISLSIENLSDDTRTYGLIGVNEAGKSSVLKAIALMGNDSIPNAKDFRNSDLPISISITYKLKVAILNRGKMEPEATHLEMEFLKSNASYDQIEVTHLFEAATSTKKITSLARASDGAVKEMQISEIPSTLLFSPIFWTAEEKYLISRPIQLAQFAENPGHISIPLRNCFLLAGYSDIPNAIRSLHDSTDKEHLQDILGEAVTNHINSVWPGHPIKITFSIDGDQINFHVKDEGSNAKAKTADQRSDGFKQFVSFLLTVSAENKKEQLSNSILLVDEPETHLHPKAQQYFLNELKEITKVDRRNIVFFATHSTFMIDRNDLSRNFRVTKTADETALERFDKNSATYNKVNFEVFDIYSTDYHNELYATLHAKHKKDFPENKNLWQIKEFDVTFFHGKHGFEKNKPSKGCPNELTLSSYIRNCIHHSESGEIYTQEDLVASTLRMRNCLDTKVQ